MLVTGGAGFIGSHLVDALLERPDARVTVIDRLSTGGSRMNLAQHDEDPRFAFVRADVNEEHVVDELVEAADLVVHAAAESHVDRSIDDPRPFAVTNVLGTQIVLEAVRRHGRRMLMISTDEVYGPGDPAGGLFAEDAPVAPHSPYAASKAAADLLVRSYVHTFGLPAVITRCSNNYGPYQFPEKLVPLMITNAVEGRRLPVFGDGRQVRDWIHVEDHCAGVLAALERGRAGEVYNFGARAERANLDIVSRIVVLTGVAPGLVEHVADRPAHDRRYAMDAAKAERELGWRPARSFEQGLADTVRWYVEHEQWWRAVKNGSYRDFYRTWYEERGS